MPVRPALLLATMASVRATASGGRALAAYDHSHDVVLARTALGYIHVSDVTRLANTASPNKALLALSDAVSAAHS